MYLTRGAESSAFTPSLSLLGRSLLDALRHVGSDCRVAIPSVEADHGLPGSISRRCLAKHPSTSFGLAPHRIRRLFHGGRPASSCRGTQVATSARGRSGLGLGRAERVLPIVVAASTRTRTWSGTTTRLPLDRGFARADSRQTYDAGRNRRRSGPRCRRPGAFVVPFGFQVPGPVSVEPREFEEIPFQEDSRRGNLYVPPTFASRGFVSFPGKRAAVSGAERNRHLLPSVTGLATASGDATDAYRQVERLLTSLIPFVDGFVWSPMLAGSPELLQEAEFERHAELMARVAPAKLKLVELPAYEEPRRDAWLGLVRGVSHAWRRRDCRRARPGGASLGGSPPGPVAGRDRTAVRRGRGRLPAAGDHRRTAGLPDGLHRRVWGLPSPRRCLRGRDRQRRLSRRRRSHATDRAWPEASWANSPCVSGTCRRRASPMPPPYRITSGQWMRMTGQEGGELTKKCNDSDKAASPWLRLLGQFATRTGNCGPSWRVEQWA